MTILDIILLASSGLVAGAVNALAGGGTFFTFGALVVSGLPPVIANATSAVAVSPANLASAFAYRREIAQNVRCFTWLLAASLLGGLIGASLLLTIGGSEFRALVPWLLLAATLLFATSPLIAKLVKRDSTPAGPVGRGAALVLHFFTSIYGGFFGAGMGIVMLATLAVSEGSDYHRINAGKNLFAVVIQGVAVVLFIAGGIVSWSEAAVVTVFSIAGGYYGVVVGRRIPQEVIRWCVVATGVLLSLFFFVRG